MHPCFIVRIVTLLKLIILCQDCNYAVKGCTQKISEEARVNFFKFE